MINHKSSGGILFNSNLNKVFLINKIERNEWNLPKGHIEDGESPIDTAKREIKEETGFSRFIIIGSSPCDMVNYNFKDEKGKENYKTVYYYPVVVFDKKRIKTKQMLTEGLSGQWFSLEEAINKTKSKNIFNTIIKAYDFIKNLKN